MTGDTEFTIEESTGNEEATKAAWAKCPNCGHCWPAAYYPMNLETFARVMEKHSDCPKCDTPGVVAKQDNGELTEAGDAA